MWVKEIYNLLSEHPSRELPVGNLIRSAVLVPLSAENGMLSLTLIQRTLQVKHPGQLSFPGGYVKKTDKDLLETALRETEEEIGIPSKTILPLGRLSDQVTPTGFWIRPFVGCVPKEVACVCDTEEVERVINVPLLDLDEHHREPAMYRWKEYVIWGVTARWIEELMSVLFSRRESF